MANLLALNGNVINCGAGTIYSTSERIVGQWIDGKPLYEKVIDCGQAPGKNTIKNVDHGITDLGTAISLQGFGQRSSDGQQLFLPNISRGAVNNQTSLSINSTQIAINNGSASDLDQNFYVYMIVRYTKTTD